MNYILNFDVFFAILLIGMTISAIFKKSGKYVLNYFLFSLSATTIGLLVYFNVDAMLLSKIGASLTPLFNSMKPFLNNSALYGLFYFLILIILTITYYWLLKLIVKLFVNDSRRFKKDTTYTPKHNGFASYLISFLKFVIVAHAILIIFVYVNPLLGFNTENSFFIQLFNQYEKPLIEFIQTKGTAFFKAVGY